VPATSSGNLTFTSRRGPNLAHSPSSAVVRGCSATPLSCSLCLPRFAEPAKNKAELVPRLRTRIQFSHYHSMWSLNVS
jgi:hypothetical protein